MIKSHRIRLHPTPEQRQYFVQAAGIRRFVYNWALAEYQRQYAAYKDGKQAQPPSVMDLKQQFNAIREQQFPWTYHVSKSVIEGAFFDLRDAFKHFFAGLKAGRPVGYPKYKKKGKSHESFYLANDRFEIGAHWIRPQVMGEFVARLKGQALNQAQKRHVGKVNLAEKLRFSGKMVGATVSAAAGWWFISIQVEIPHVVPENTRPIVGIDVGIKAAAIVSDGRRFENQKPLTTQLKQLQRLGRHLSKKAYDPATRTSSKNREKARLKVARLHDAIACRRADAHHKMTTEIARTCGGIGIEDLHVKGLMKNRRLARAMADAGLGQLLRMFETKMEAAGGKTVVIDRFFPSTKRCSGCGQVKQRMPLKYRTYHCLVCGLVIDRDLNAAINLEREARRHLRLAG